MQVNILFPLYGAGGFGCDVVGDAVYAFYSGDYSGAYAGQQVMR